jgi:hypothetical protein
VTNPYWRRKIPQPTAGKKIAKQIQHVDTEIAVIRVRFVRTWSISLAKQAAGQTIATPNRPMGMKAIAGELAVANASRPRNMAPDNRISSNPAAAQTTSATNNSESLEPERRPRSALIRFVF